MSGLPVLALGDEERLWPACGLAMAVYLAICGWLWRHQYGWVQRGGQAVGIGDTEALLSSAANWFIPTQSVLTILITLAQLIPVWGFADRTDRFLAAMVPFCGSLGLAAPAPAASSKRTSEGSNQGSPAAASRARKAAERLRFAAAGAAADAPLAPRPAPGARARRPAAERGTLLAAPEIRSLNVCPRSRLQPRAALFPLGRGLYPYPRNDGVRAQRAGGGCPARR